MRYEVTNDKEVVIATFDDVHGVPESVQRMANVQRQTLFLRDLIERTKSVIAPNQKAAVKLVGVHVRVHELDRQAVLDYAQQLRDTRRALEG